MRSNSAADSFGSVAPEGYPKNSVTYEKGDEIPRELAECVLKIIRARSRWWMTMVRSSSRTRRPTIARHGRGGSLEIGRDFPSSRVQP